MVFQDIYFVFEFYQNNDIRIRAMTHGDLEDYVNDIAENNPGFMSRIIKSTSDLGKWLNFVPDGKIMIIKGGLVIPEAVKEVTKYKVPH